MTSREVALQLLLYVMQVLRYIGSKGFRNSTQPTYKDVIRRTLATPCEAIQSATRHGMRI